jgi:hypothetical protein
MLASLRAECIEERDKVALCFETQNEDAARGRMQLWWGVRIVIVTIHPISKTDEYIGDYNWRLTELDHSSPRHGAIPRIDPSRVRLSTVRLTPLGSDRCLAMSFLDTPQADSKACSRFIDMSWSWVHLDRW